MNTKEQLTNKIFQEIMEIEVEISRIMALNGNKESLIVKNYLQLIQTKQKKLNKINLNYKAQIKQLRDQKPK